MKNWKTTLAGLIGALAFALQNYNGANTWQGYLGAFAVAAAGFLAKDFDTHSTVEQTQTATIEAVDSAIAAVNKQ